MPLKGSLIAVDTETTGLNPWGDIGRWGFHPARPFAFSFFDAHGNSAYVRWSVDPKTRRVIPNPKDYGFLRNILENEKITKVFHNAAYDIRMVGFAGFKVRGTIHDTLILMHVATGGSEMSYALKPLAVKYLNYSNQDEKDLEEATKVARREAHKKGWPVAVKEMMGREPVKADFWMAPPEVCKKYAVSDAERTMLLWLMAGDETLKDPSLGKVYNREMRLFHVLKRMEDMGVRVFPTNLKQLTAFYEKYASEQVATADKIGGKGLNFRSSKQMTTKFYVEKGYPAKYNERGNYSLDSDVLADLAEKDALARCILEYRAATHTLSSFLKVYERWRVAESRDSWVLHPNFRQCGPVTGRLSCSDPNLMQVASDTTGRKRSQIGYRQREAFGPREGCVWYLPDYSQIEVWLFAALSQDTDLLQALQAGQDAHGEISKSVWGKEKDYVERHAYYRKRAKLLVFCILYGGGIRKIAKLLESTEEEAAKFLNDFINRFPGTKQFMRRMINRADREGKIENPFGRVYYIDKGFGYRAVNYLVQGTAADILKNAMIHLHELFQTKWKGVNLLLPLHDEIVIEVPKELHSKELMRDIIRAMQEDSETVGVPVPLPVGMKISTHRWSSTKEIEL